MEFSTIYDVCVGSGRSFKLTQEMLDAIEERMKQDDKTSRMYVYSSACNFTNVCFVMYFKIATEISPAIVQHTACGEGL